MKSNNGVREVRVGPHPGRQRQRKVRECSHDDAADEGGSHGGDDQVFPDPVEAGGVARVDRVELAGGVGLDDAEVRISGAVGWGEGGVGAEGDAVGDGAGAAGVGEDGGVDGEDVGHGEEGGGAGAEFGGEGGVAVGEFEAFPDSACCYVRVETIQWRAFGGELLRWGGLHLHLDLRVLDMRVSFY